ncbi:peptidyl-prolyl cis-trans isomerase [Neptuniibacter sp. PT34_22]|uniref:peptidylprolyl isomerase n=1 Tax=Neptuniibacter sp. PT34_22 TaxID=3398205 RepID=UPI0039F4CE55
MLPRKLRSSLPLLTLSALVTLSGCSEKSEDAPKATSQTPATQSVQPDALVSVNGESITQQDLEFTIRRTFSQAELLYANEEVNQKVLQSLIAGEAMKQKIKQELSEDTLGEIAQKVKAYEQELFIKEYLSHYAQPQPVSVSMVQDYYTKNPDQFGGTTIKQLEILRSSKPLDDELKQSVLQNQPQIETSDDWAQLVQNLPGDLVLQKTSSAGQLDTRLTQAINTLNKGQVTSAIFIEGNIYFAKVVGETTLPPKPLSEVSGQIRKMLSPQQVRKAVKRASDEVVAEAKIEYHQ